MNCLHTGSSTAPLQPVLAACSVSCTVLVQARDVMRISKIFRKLCFKGRRKVAEPTEAKAGLTFAHKAGS